MSGTFDAEDKRPHWVYRIFDGAGRLLYIGCAYDLNQRLAQHHVPRTAETRITAKRYPTKTEARRAEREAIAAERPLLNKQHNPARPEPEPAVTFAEMRDAVNRLGAALLDTT